MLFSEIILVYYGNYMKHINALCGQDAKFSNVKNRRHRTSAPSFISYKNNYIAYLTPVQIF